MNRQTIDSSAMLDMLAGVDNGYQVLWVDIHEEEPELKDESVLMHFENGSIETVHIEDFFRPITNGVKDGVQQWTKWWMKHDPACTHWMQLPSPPNAEAKTSA